MSANTESPATRRAAVAVGAVAAGLFGGCGAPTQLHVQDSAELIGSVRAVHRFGEGPGGGGIEIAASRARAQGEQRLQAFETATLNGRSITGPVTLRHDARVERAQIVYNHLLFAGRPVELEWFAGGAAVATRWNTASPVPTDPQLTSRTTWYGPAGGALGRLRLAPMLSLELRYEGAIKVTGAIDSASHYQVETALALRPLPGLALRIGFAESRGWVQPSFSESELSVRSRGPLLNLGFEF
jgi:hypothetical protein